MLLINHPVVTIVHRESKYVSFSVEKNLSKILVNEKINTLVDKEAVLFTDEYTIYSKISENEKISKHFTVNHSQKEYSNGVIHVNNCENRHSLLRPFLRIFRGVSKHNLAGYVMIAQYLINYKENATDMILKTVLRT